MTFTRPTILELINIFPELAWTLFAHIRQPSFFLWKVFCFGFTLNFTVLNWWKGKPSGSIACTRKRQPRFYWSCSSVVMNDATPLMPLAHERNSIFKYKQHTCTLHDSWGPVCLSIWHKVWFINISRLGFKNSFAIKKNIAYLTTTQDAEVRIHT